MGELFWELEHRYLKESDKALKKCEEVTNLKEALDTELDQIWLVIPNQDTDYVGYKTHDGYELSAPYDAMWENGKRDGLEVTYCHFVEFQVNNEGNTVGYFEMERPYDAE